jgi:hypothetical protein
MGKVKEINLEVILRKVNRIRDIYFRTSLIIKTNSKLFLNEMRINVTVMRLKWMKLLINKEQEPT